MDDMKALLLLLAFILFGVAVIYFRFKEAKDKKVFKDGVRVCARFKKFENGKWVCKFFWAGDHMGYMERKPSSERVDAVVVGYDEELKLFQLREFVSFNESEL